MPLAIKICSQSEITTTVDPCAFRKFSWILFCKHWKKQYFNASIWSLNEKYVVMIWLIIMFQTIRRVEYCYYLGLFFGRICLIFFVQFHYWHQDLDIYSPKTETWINFYPIDRSEYLGLSLFRNLSTLHSRNKLQSRYQHDISSHI